MRLLQVIDVGTNSVRSNIVEVPVGGPHRIIDDEKEMTRLGQGLDATGQLDPRAVDRTVSALKAMMDIGRNLGVTEVRAIATEAVRRASNGQELVDRLCCSFWAQILQAAFDLQSEVCNSLSWQAKNVCVLLDCKR